MLAPLGIEAQHPDGTRLLAVQLDDEGIPDEIRAITNFFDEIRRVCGQSSSR